MANKVTNLLKLYAALTLSSAYWKTYTSKLISGKQDRKDAFKQWCNDAMIQAMMQAICDYKQYAIT